MDWFDTEVLLPKAVTEQLDRIEEKLDLMLDNQGILPETGPLSLSPPHGHALIGDARITVCHAVEEEMRLSVISMAEVDWSDVTCSECLKHAPEEELVHLALEPSDMRNGRIINEHKDKPLACGLIKGDNDWRYYDEKEPIYWSAITCPKCLEHKPRYLEDVWHATDTDEMETMCGIGLRDNREKHIKRNTILYKEVWKLVTCPKCLEHKP